MSSQKDNKILLDVSFNWNQNPDRARAELQKVSPSYCLAKWAHSTIHFQLGTTHSCYNLPMHQIPKNNLSSNPSSLHNTPIKLEQRQQMLDGKRPPECAYCWNIEDLNSDNWSDRIIQSSGDWAYPSANEIYLSGLGEKIAPKYLEVSFSNNCNFKCSYCSPIHSNLWHDEIQKMGHYPVKTLHKMPSQIYSEEENPYIEAFNKWWPDLSKSLKVFRITGGEPLLSKHTWMILDDIKKNPLPDLTLSLNSNLGVSDILIDQLILKLKRLIETKSIKRCTLFTSIEATGEHAEYIRHGMNYQKFISNIQKILREIPEIRISIMATFCALSVFSFKDLLKTILEIRNQYASDFNKFQRLGISTNYLRFPDHLSVHVLNEEAIKFFDEISDFFKKNQFDSEKYVIGFNRQEIAQFENVKQWFKHGNPSSQKNQLKTDFKNYFQEYDRRRGTSLYQTFNDLINYI